MVSHRRRAAAICLATAAALVPSLWPGSPVAAAAPAPSVTISVGPERHESLLGGACYRGNVEVDQPAGFVITRTPPLDQPLEVALSLSVFRTDVVQRIPSSVTIPAGSATALVPRPRASEPSISAASWGASILEGAYAIDAGNAQFTGYIPADPATMGGSCEIHDDTRRSRLQVGDEVLPEDYLYRVRDFTLISGELPPGLHLGEAGVSGTVAKAGRWTARVSECPWPAIGDRICGQLTLIYEVTGSQEPPDESNAGGPPDASAGPDEATGDDASSTSTISEAPSTDDEPLPDLAVASEDTPGSTGTRPVGVAVAAVGLAGLSLVIARALRERTDRGSHMG
jgi:hypothetical protein